MSRRRTRRWSAPHSIPGAIGLLWHQVRVDPLVSLLLAVLVALASLLVTVGPRILTDLNSRQVAYTLDGLSVLQRDVRATVVSDNANFEVASDGVRFDPPEQTWAPVTGGLEQVRTKQPEPLRSVLQPGKFYVDVGPPAQAPDDPESDIATIELQYRVDPLLTELVDLVEGDWPEPTVPLPGVQFDGPNGPTQVDGSAELDIVLSEDAAEQLKWEVGEVRDVPAVAPTRLSGVYVPTDPDDPHWDHSDYGAELSVFNDFDLGKLATAAAYLAPGNPGVTALGATREFHFWYPLDAADVPGDDVAALTSQLGGLIAASVSVVTDPSDPGDTGDAGADELRVVSALDAKFVTEIFDVLRGLSQQQRATVSLLAVVSAGPIGVAVIVFVLGARLIVTRRRATLALTFARGASPAQIRGILAAEAALFSVPAAGLGYAVAGLVVPRAGPQSRLLGPWPPGDWYTLGAVVLVGLAPSLALLAAVATPSLRATRADLGGPVRRQRARLVIEIGVVSLAAIALWRLLDRGLSGVSVAVDEGVESGNFAAPGTSVIAETDVGVDLLVAATPVLLALAAAVLTLRLYPIPLRALTRVLASRTDLAAFVGATRSLRDPAGGLVPALAVIVGIAVAASAAVLTSTIADGAEHAAWEATGAQIRLSGPRVTDDLVATLRDVPGVADVARISGSPRPVAVSGAGVDARSASVYIVDDELADVVRAAPAITPLPAAVYAPGQDLRVLTGGELSSTDGEVGLGGIGSAREVGHLDVLPGAPVDSVFLVASRSTWEAAGASVPVANLALLSVSGTADREEVAQAVAREVPNSRVETPQARFDAFQEAPVTSGLSQMFTVAVALTLALTVLATLLVQAIGAPSRTKLLALLRTVGMSRRQGRGLIAWELAPMFVVAFVIGATVGLTVSWLLIQAVDLRGLTGSPSQPPLAIDPAALTLMAGGLVAVVTTTVFVSAAIASRTDVAQHVRLGEER